MTKKLYSNPELYDEERAKSRENTETISISDTQSINESFALATESGIAGRIFGDVPSEVEIHLANSGIKCSNYFNSITFVTNYIVNSWLGNDHCLSDTDTFIQLIKEDHILHTISSIFTCFKKMSIYQIEEEKGYNQVKEIFLMCLTQSQIKYNVIVPIELINIANTYYFPVTEIGGEEVKRIYLMEGIKEHSIFKQLEFWEGYLLRIIDVSRKTYDFSSPSKKSEDSKRQFRERINDCFFGIAMRMKEIVSDEQQIFQLLGNYFKAYKLDKSGLEKLKMVISGKISD